MKPGLEHQRRSPLPFSVLIAGLAMTAMLTFYVARTDDMRGRLQFQAVAQKLLSTIESRLDSYITLLRGGSGLFAVNPELTRAQFKAYVDQLHLPQVYPGAQGIGFSLRVPAGERAALVESLRRQGEADFKLWPEGERPETHAIIYLEPETPRNRVALGYDMSSEPRRRAAMMTAMDTGLPAATGKITLVQDTDAQRQPGFIIYYPVYRGGQTPATVEERRRELRGFVYCAFRAGDLFRSILGGQTASQIQIDVYDGQATTPGTRLYDSAEDRKAPRHEPRFSEPRTFEIAGEPWTVVFSSLPEFESASARHLIWLLAVAATGISLLLFFSAAAEAKALRLAQRRAEELRASEASLRESEERYRTIAETAADGILTTDERGRILSANQSMEQFFGCPEAELIGKSIDDFLSKPRNKLRESDGGHWLSAAQPHQPTRGLLVSGRNKDGLELTFEISVGVSSDHDRRRYTLIVRDLSDRRKLQQALFQVQKMQAIGSLANGVAHDFNNLLAAMLMQLELAMDTAGLPDEVVRLLASCRSTATRGAELISRLQAFSRQSTPKLGRVNLAATAGEILALLQRTITRRIQITTRIEATEPWFVNADEDRLKQVLVNLCLNARDAMPQGGEMVIAVAHVTVGEAEARPPRRAGQFVRLTVSDTGTGMPSEVRDRMFEPYFTTKEFGKGAGLGLAIAHTIITEHGGWMEVESQLGRGSQFHVFLPRLETAAETPVVAVETAADRKRALEGSETILIAEDEESIRTLLAAVLSYRGYRIIEATNGQEALDRFRENLDVVAAALLDFNMPGLGGLDAWEQMRPLKPGVCAFILTGGDVTLVAERARQAGAAGCIAKPFNNSEVLAAIRQALDARRGATPTGSASHPATAQE